MSSADRGAQDAQTLVAGLNGARLTVDPPKLFGDCREAYVRAFIKELAEREGIHLSTIGVACVVVCRYCNGVGKVAGDPQNHGPAKVCPSCDGAKVVTL